MRQDIAKLSRTELLELQAAIDERLVHLADAELKPAENRGGLGEAAPGREKRGSVEMKMINGCGPYAYLRYWEGGHLRSKYIGKVGKESASKG